MLGADYDVRNFGLSGTTLLKAGDHPYWTSDQYTQSHAFAPNIVIIMLGTNDSKPQNWSHKDEFVNDYEELIDSYATLASAPKIYLNLPPPAGTNGFGISGTVIENEVVPLVQQVAANKHTGLIDVFSAFGGHDFDASLFGSPGDQVHPNGAGGQRIAETVYAALTAPPIVDAGVDASDGEDGGAVVDGSVPSAGASGAGTDGGGSGGAPTIAGAGGETAGSPSSSGGASGSGGSANGGNATSPSDEDDDDGGCAVTSGAGKRDQAWALGAAIATLWVARRRH
jgi:lysophospholipase L1-like esterase